MPKITVNVYQPTVCKSISTESTDKILGKIRKKTPKGVNLMIIVVINMVTSLQEVKNNLNGSADLSSLAITIPTINDIVTIPIIFVLDSRVSL